MRKSLCIDARMVFFSGIGTYLREIIPRLEKMCEFDITLLVGLKHSFKSGSKKIEVNPSIYSLFAQIPFCSSIPTCDLFWSPHFNIPLLPIRACKKAVTIHDVCHLAQKECFSWIKKKGAEFYISEALKKSDLILTVSSFSKGEILRYFPSTSKEVHVIRSGAPFRVGNLPSLSSKKPFILYVGHIRSHKNIRRLLEAFKRFPEKEVDLVLAGKVSMHLPPLGPNIQVQENLSNEEIASLYTQASLLIHPSLYEGFGFTPLEAMSYGCPVVVSSFASLPEVCADAAYYVDPLSIDSLYLGMQKVLKDPFLRRDLILKGYERIQFFSWDQTAQNIADLFLKELCLP